VRQLLFAGLLLADALSDKPSDPRAAASLPSEAVPAPVAQPVDESDTLATLSRLAERIEALGDGLAAQLASA